MKKELLIIGGATLLIWTVIGVYFANQGAPVKFKGPLGFGIDVN